MLQRDIEIAETFKALVSKRTKVHEVKVFGSRARGDSSPYSDMDVLVVLDGTPDDKTADYISDCAWEAGFEFGVVVVPVVFSLDEWQNSPERFSLLAQAVEKEGVLV